MKISPINYNNIHKSMNFTGLWGKTSSRTDFEQSLGVPKVEDTYYYYPFEKETDEEIQKVIDENTNAYIEEDNGVARYKVKSCKLCTTLPFKEVNFRDYSNFTPNNKLTTNIKKVHFCVKDKYVTNDYGSDQVSAVNDAVTAKILNLKG